MNRTRGTSYKAFGSNRDLRPGLMASPVQSSVQCLKHKVQRRRPARTWYNPHELRELWYRGPHPICMHVYYVAIPLHDRGTRTRGPRICWTPRTKTYASGSPGSLDGVTAGSARGRAVCLTRTDFFAQDGRLAGWLGKFNHLPSQPKFCLALDKLWVMASLLSPLLGNPPHLPQSPHGFQAVVLASLAFFFRRPGPLPMLLPSPFVLPKL